jgi:predicted ATP-grasp superfamily ATP-dependent carboligase
MARARALGIDVPKSILIEDLAELDGLPDGFQYPVVLKARRSRWFEGGRWQEGGVRVVRDAAQLEDSARDSGFSAGCLIQEFVPGHGEGLFFLADRGQIVARFAHRRLREKPPSGGVSVLSESVSPDPALLEASERLLAELEWHGVAMVEFRRSPTGRAVLMEINPRLWGSLQLAIDAGVDFPRLMVDLYSGKRVDTGPSRTGVKLRWLLGDWDHLLIALRRREMRKNLGRTPLGVIAAFFASFFDGSRLEVLRRDDPAPFFYELREWFR